MNEGTRNEAPLESSRGPFPWQRGWSIFKTLWPQLIYISMAAIAIPQYLVDWMSALRAANVVQSMHTEPAQGFFTLFEQAEGFSLISMGELIIAGFLALWGYLAWVTAAFAHIDGQKVDTLLVLRKSFRLLLPKGLFTFLLFGLFLSGLLLLAALVPGFGVLSQLVLITLCVVAAAAPVLLVMEARGPGRIFGASLKMEYTRGSGMTRWSAYFVLLTYEMLLLGSLSLVQSGEHALNHLDSRLNLSRDIWFVVNANFPFGVIPMVSEALSIVLSTFLFCLFAIMTTSFIADLKRIGRIRSTIEIRI